MLESIPGLLKVFNTAADTLRAFTQWRAQEVGDRRALIEELKENSRFLWAVIEEEVELREVVAKLSCTEYDRLLKNGFDFNALERKPIASNASLANTNLASWQGKSTEALIVNIYDKTKELKALYPLTEHSRKINWTQRVNNVQRRIFLLLRHVGAGEL